jgi:D-amino-acid dehydrogenase
MAGLTVVASREPTARAGAPPLADAIVLGAGVVGVASAYALARDGLRVILVDERQGPGEGASFANGAQLSYAYADALASPALVPRMPALAMGLDPAFSLSPRFDPDFLAWTLSFMAGCTASAHTRSTLRTLALALESQRAMHALLQRHTLAFGHEVSGKMHLHFDAASLRNAEASVAMKRAAGAVQSVLTAAEAIAIEPALGQSKGLQGVVYSPEDAVGDPSAFCVGLTALLRDHYSVSTQFGVRALSARVHADSARLRLADGRELRAKLLVVANGVAAAPFLRRLGVRVLITPMRGYSLTAPLGADAPKVSITDTARRLVFCRLSGQMRIAGGAELGARDARVDTKRFEAFVRAARESLPGAVAWAQAKSWAGLRPMTPDSTPIITRPRARLLINAGHGMLGWTLAMGSADRLARLAAEALVEV